MNLRVPSGSCRAQFAGGQLRDVTPRRSGYEPTGFEPDSGIFQLICLAQTQNLLDLFRRKPNFAANDISSLCKTICSSTDQQFSQPVDSKSFNLGPQ